MDKYTESADGNFVTVKQTGEVQIKRRDDNRKYFFATLNNVLFSTELCDQLFSIITLINLGYKYLFHKRFCAVFFSDNEHNVVVLLHIAQQKHIFLVKMIKVKIAKANSKE